MMQRYKQGELAPDAPKRPNEAVTNSKNQIYELAKSPHNKTPEKRPNKIKSPPIVGVPIFFII